MKKKETIDKIIKQSSRKLIDDDEEKFKSGTKENRKIDELRKLEICSMERKSV